MKFSIIALAFVSILNANEMARIDLIVEDISKLRNSYASCKSELESKKSHGTAIQNTQKDNSSICKVNENDLKEYKELLKKEQQKNTLLTDKLESKPKNTPRDNQIISELERMLDEQNSALKAKENEINFLKKELAEKRKCKETPIVSPRSNNTITAIVPDENKFPKLKMKEDETPKEISREGSKEISKEVSYSSAASFRLIADCEVYDSAGGTTVVATWIKGRSFTSNQRTKNWIRVTGYFVDKVWQKATEELWIEEVNVAVK